MKNYLHADGSGNTFIGYSLGALIFTLACDEAISWGVSSASAVRRRFPKIILCQPAFSLSLNLIGAIHERPGHVSTTLLTMARRRDAILQRLELSLQNLISANTDIRIIAWNDDEFVTFDDTVQAMVARAGVAIQSVTVTSFDPPAKSAFLEHCYVPFQPAFVSQVQRAVASNISAQVDETYK
ncbi:MAG: hypothetical protein R2855_05985 [Thermomicrobiales bacterium]